MRRLKVIEEYDPPPLDCRPYEPAVAEAGRLLCELISSTRAGLKVEHVGSTSVPGCAGRGYIDLAVLYERDGLEAARATLAALGFQRQISRDPFPEERPMRVGSIRHAGKLFQIHAHVIAAGSTEAQDMVRFRDRLRVDGQLLEAYEAKKRQIVRRGVIDSLEYSQQKGQFVRSVLDGEAYEEASRGLI